MTDKATGRPYTLTRINVQGDDQEAFEVYTDETRERTIAFVFDERIAQILPQAVNHFEEMRALLLAIGTAFPPNEFTIEALALLAKLDKAAAAYRPR